MTLDRVAFIALLLLGASVGLGDVVPSSPLTAIRALLPIALILALLSSATHRRWPAFPKSLLWPVLAWFSVLLASAVFAPRHQLEAIASLERPASGALLAWAVYASCPTPRRAVRLASAFAVSGFGVAVLGLAQASGSPTVEDWLTSLHAGSVPIGDVPRVASTLSHPNLAAILLELALPLLIVWAATAPRAWRPPLSVAALTCLLALVLTFSRAGIAAALLAMACMACLSLARGRRTLALCLGLAALAVPLTLAWAVTAEPGLDRRLTAGLDESGPLSPSRIEHWTVALRMASDHAVLGVGSDNYRWEFATYSGLELDNLGVHAHNQYLEMLANAGPIGLMTLLWLFAAVARVAGADLNRASEALWPWRLALLAGLVVWFAHAVLDDFERFWPASVAFWLMTGLAIRFASLEPVHEVQEGFGSVALGGEVNPRLQRLTPMLGADAQRDNVAQRARLTESVEIAGRQTGQIPVEQDDVGVTARHLVDQPVASRALRHD